MKKKISQILVGAMIAVLSQFPCDYISPYISREETPLVYASTQKTGNTKQEDPCADGVSRMTCVPYEKESTKVTSKKKSLRKNQASSILLSGPSEYYDFFEPSEEELYYRSELTTQEQKAAYDHIVTTALEKINSIDLSNEEFKIGVEFDTSLLTTLGNGDAIEDVLMAIRSDHPEWYWMDSSYAISSNYKNIQLIGYSQFSSKATRDEIESKLMKLVKDFDKAHISLGDQTYDIVKEIHDYIIKNTYYVKGVSNAHNIIGVLLDGKGVCESYAKAAQLFYNYYDIENVYVTGTNKDPGSVGHAWNQVKVEVEGHSKAWTNIDLTWDDIANNAQNEANFPDFEGVSYRYFCRSEKEFKHLKTYNGDYIADCNIKSCVDDAFNYFAITGQYYLSSVSNIPTLMTQIEEKIKDGTLVGHDGIYKIRLGYAAALSLRDFYNELKKDHLVYYTSSGGAEGDQFVSFHDDRAYRLGNITANEHGTIFATENDCKSNNKWSSGSQLTRTIGAKSFYIRPEAGYSIEKISYQYGPSGEKQYVTLQDDVSLYDEANNIYECKLPVNINAGDAIYFDVTYTQEGMATIAFEKKEYEVTYGDSITMNVNISGSNGINPTGKFIIYQDKIDEEHKIAGFDSISIADGKATFSLNNGHSDLPAGTYKIYAQYQGDTNYPSKQIASATVTIGKAELIYVPQDMESWYGKTKTYQGRVEEDGFKYGEDASVITKLPVLTSVATKESTVGNYTITVKEQGEAKNYKIKVSPQTATLKVEKATPTVELDASILSGASSGKVAVGGIIRLTISVQNPYDSSLKANLPNKNQIKLYLNGTRIEEDIQETDEVGVYTYDYLVQESEGSLKFTVKTDEIANYYANTSTEKKIDIESNSYVVSFDLRGHGNGSGIPSQTIQKNGKIVKPADPEDLSGTYRFEGWYTNTNYTDSWSFDVDTVNRSMTLFAKWIQPEKTPITDVVVTPKEGLIYTGEQQELVTITGLKTDDRVTYTLGNVSSSEIPKVKNAGTYTLKVKVSRKWHKDYETQVEITVAQAESEVVVNSVVTKEYTGDPVRITDVTVKGKSVAEILDASKVTYKFYLDSLCVVPTSAEHGASISGGAPKEAGTYYFEAYFPGQGNFSSSYQSAKLIIEKGNIDVILKDSQYVVADEASSYEYLLTQLLPTQYKFGKVTYEIMSIEDPNQILVADSAKITNDMLSYKTSANVAPSKSAIITIQIKSENYKPKEAKLVIYPKEKTEVVISGITDNDKVSYNGQSYQYKGTYVVKEKLTGNTINLAMDVFYEGTRADGTAYAKTSTAPKDAGQYKVVFEVPSNNKQYKGTVAYQFEIKPAQLTISVKDVVLNVGAEKPDFEITYEGVVEGDTVTGVVTNCSYIKNDATYGKSGVYEITVSGGTLNQPYNYNVKREAGKLTVKDLHTITFKMGLYGVDDPTTLYACEGQSITLPVPTAIKENCVFEGWVVENDTSGRVYVAQETYLCVDRDVVFRPKWVQKESITKITAEYTGKDLIVGTTVSKSNVRVKAHYSNGNQVDISEFILTPDTVTNEGSNVITVSYQNCTCAIVVTGYVNNIATMNATYNGTVRNGQKIDTNNLTLEVTYMDGTKKIIRDGYTINEYTIIVGDNRLTLQYQNKTTTFSVTGVSADGTAVLTFDSQGGNTISSATVEIGKKYSPPTNVTRYGYVFRGWFTQKYGGGTQLTANTVIEKSATYYAYWVSESSSISKIYASYRGDGIVGPLKESDFNVVAQYGSGSRMLVHGFTMSSNTLVPGVNRIQITYQGISTLVTINAKYRENDLIVNVKDKDYIEGYVLTQHDLTVLLVSGTGNTNTITDYTLSDNVIKVGENNVKISYQGVSTIVTITGLKKCKVWFDTMGGKKIEPIDVISGKKLTSLPTPKRVGYLFEGWYFDEKYVRKCTQTNTIENNVTLYAKWSKDKAYKISREYINLKPYEEQSIYVANIDNVYWDSEDLNIASVSQDGIIIGINKGTTTITGITPDGYKVSCVVTVGQKVKKITVKKTKVSLKVGKTYKINAVVTPKKAVTKKLSYSTTDSSVAVVDKKGKIVAKGKGTCYIKIKTTDASHLEKRIKVTVK